jgi:hypothetical protein
VVIAAACAARTGDHLVAAIHESLEGRFNFSVGCHFVPPLLIPEQIEQEQPLGLGEADGVSDWIAWSVRRSDRELDAGIVEPLNEPLDGRGVLVVSILDWHGQSFFGAAM